MDTETLTEKIVQFIAQLDDDARADPDLLLGAVAEGLHLQEIANATQKTASITLVQLAPALEQFLRDYAKAQPI